MKKPLDSKTMAIAIGAVIFGVVIAGVLFFKDSFAPAPTVTPKPWSPPGAWSGASQGGSAQPASAQGGTVPGSPADRLGRSAGAPIGAPAGSK